MSARDPLAAFSRPDRRLRIRVYRNTSPVRWKSGRLPVSQRLFWVGPLFILVQSS